MDFPLKQQISTTFSTQFYMTRLVIFAQTSKIVFLIVNLQRDASAAGKPIIGGKSDLETTKPRAKSELTNASAMENATALNEIAFEIPSASSPRKIFLCY